MIRLVDAFDYRQEMRNFIIDLSEYAKSYDSHFLIIPQNGQELMTDNGEGNGTPEMHYLQLLMQREEKVCFTDIIEMINQHQ